MIAAPVPPPASMTTQELVVYAAIGLYAVKELLVPLVRGSFARNLAAEDKAKEELKGEVNKLASAVDSLRDAVRELREVPGKLASLDTRIAEQGKELRAEIQRKFSEAMMVAQQAAERRPRAASPRERASQE